MDIKIYRSESRGQADHGWLQSRFSFSFAEYYNPDRIQFGKLRVLNDDIIEPGTGFDTHPHSNMEIISIPIDGTLAHRDSEGHVQNIGPGEVQVMSAGSGIYHSEYNASQTKASNFLQIWIFPDQRHVPPRYDQRQFDDSLFIGRFYPVVTGNRNGDSLWIHQDAEIAMARFPEPGSASLPELKAGEGLHLFVIEGEASFPDYKLNRRDAAEITGPLNADVQAAAGSWLLCIKVPLE